MVEYFLTRFFNNLFFSFASDRFSGVSEGKEKLSSVVSEGQVELSSLELSSNGGGEGHRGFMNDMNDLDIRLRSNSSND